MTFMFIWRSGVVVMLSIVACRVVQTRSCLLVELAFLLECGVVVVAVFVDVEILDLHVNIDLLRLGCVGRCRLSFLLRMS